MSYHVEMRLAWLALVVPTLSLAAFAACVGEDPAANPPASDAGASGEGGSSSSSGGSSSGDAGGDAPSGPRCDPSKGFGVPAEIATGSGPGEDLSPRLSPDERTIFLSTTRSKPRFTLVRADRIGPLAFSAPVEVLAPPNLGRNELNPTLTADGALLVFSASTRPDGGGGDPYSGRVLHYATATGGPFGPAQVLVGPFSSDDADPYLLPDGSALFFTYTNPNGRREIQRLRRQDPDAGASLYGSPTEVLSDSVLSYAAPVVSADGTTLFVARSDNFNDANKLEIYQFTIAGGVVTGGAPLTAINDAMSLDIPTWISPDGCALYLTSNRSGAMRSYVAYRAR